MLAAGPWAQMMFGTARLGDARRVQRAIRMAQALATHPQHSLPQALETWAALKAAYRLLAQPEVTHARLIQPHLQWTRAQCRQRGEYVLAADMTQLDFSTHRAATGLGRIGDDGGRGLMVHTMLALRLEPDALAQPAPAARVVGLFDQQVWRRLEPAYKGRERKAERLQRPRQSERWGAALAQEAALAADVQWTFVGDREADIYELFAQRLPPGCALVVRANQPRALLAPAGFDLPAALAKAPLLGHDEVILRARPGTCARTARLELRALAVTLRPPWRPGRKLPPVSLWAVQAREASAPAGAAKLHWILLSTQPCADIEQARRALRVYGLRWLIEEYHKALKTGTRIEHSQLATAERLEALLGILGPVAARLLDAKLLGRARPEASADTALCDPLVQRVLEKSVGHPAGGWTNRNLVRAIARLGGFLARTGDGEPGWQTLWRGWQILQQRIHGFILALDG